MNYTYLTAAIEILRQFNTPMTSAQIWFEIEKQNLYKTNDISPKLSLERYLSKYSINSDRYDKVDKKDSKFEIIETDPMKYNSMKFKLLNFNEKYEDVEDVENLKKEIRNSIHNNSSSYEVVFYKHLEKCIKISYESYNAVEKCKHSLLFKVSSGERKNHKGWKCEKIN